MDLCFLTWSFKVSIFLLPPSSSILDLTSCIQIFPYFYDVQRYYQILRLKQGFSLPELKKAYRNSAKHYHPDINHKPNAHEKFILLNEAYEYFLSRKTGRTYNPKSKKYQKTKPHNTHAEWAAREQQKTRKRADGYAKMNWDKFEQTPIYRSAMVVSFILNYCYLISGVLMALTPPIATVIDGIINPHRIITLIATTIIGVGLVVMFWPDTIGKKY